MEKSRVEIDETLDKLFKRGYSTHAALFGIARHELQEVPEDQLEDIVTEYLDAKIYHYSTGLNLYGNN